MIRARSMLAITLVLGFVAGREFTSTSATSAKPPSASSCPRGRTTSASSTAPPIRPRQDARHVFRPTTSQEGDRIVMPITFPDGSTAELVYAPELELESALVVPNWSATVRIGDESASSDFAVRYGSLKSSVAPFATLKSTERGAHGTTVCVLDFEPPLGRAYLVYRFGRWIVGVHSADAMTPKVRRAWAAGLTGSVSPDGFLILDTTGAVKFTPSGQLHGPELTFQKDRGGITLRVGACAPDEQSYQVELPDYGSRCVPGTGIQITVGGYPRPANEVLSGLDVRKVVDANR